MRFKGMQRVLMVALWGLKGREMLRVESRG